jgi:YVTN family beta-propeller protein
MPTLTTALTAMIVGAVFLFTAPSAAASLIDDDDDSAPPAEKAGTLIVLNKSDASASLIDPATGETVRTLEVGEGPHEVAVSPDGRTAVVAVYGVREPGHTLAVIDVPAGTIAKTIDLEDYHRPHGIMYLPDGERVVVTAEVERSLIIVNVTTGEVEAAINTDQDISHMVALTPDAKTAYVANIRSNSVSVIDLEARGLKTIIETDLGAEGVAVAPDGGSVWVSNRAADNLSVIDTATNAVVSTIPCETFPIRVMFTPDGRHLLVSNARSGDVAVFDAADRREVARIAIKDEAVDEEEQSRRLFGRTFGNSPVPIGIVVQPDGRRAYVANSNSDTVVVIDTSTWTIVDRFTTGREPDGLGWSKHRVAPPTPPAPADD